MISPAFNRFRSSLTVGNEEHPPPYGYAYDGHSVHSSDIFPEKMHLFHEDDFRDVEYYSDNEQYIPASTRRSVHLRLGRENDLIAVTIDRLLFPMDTAVAESRG